jgi:hypothetical protein
MSPAQIRGSTLLKNRSFQRVQIARNRANYQSLPTQKWSDLIGREIDSFSAWNGGVAREVHDVTPG